MNKSKGIFYALFSSAAFGFMPIFAKYAYNHGINSSTLVLFRFLFAWIILLPMLIYKKQSLKLNKKQLITVISVGILTYATTTLTLFLSYQYIAVGLATTIHFIYPIVVTIISIIIFKEKIFKEKIFALILSSVGVFMLIYNGSIKLNFLGVFYALFSGVLYSIYISSVDHSELRNINAFVLTFYLSLISFVTLLTTGIITKSINFNVDIRCYGGAFMISLISTVIAVTAFQKGIRIIGSSNASILSTFEPIVSLILGVILFKEPLSFRIVLGCILIFSSVILLTKGYKKHKETVS